jgi:hypothetical protein
VRWVQRQLRRPDRVVQVTGVVAVHRALAVVDEPCCRGDPGDADRLIVSKPGDELEDVVRGVANHRALRPQPEGHRFSTSCIAQGLNEAIRDPRALRGRAQLLRPEDELGAACGIRAVRELTVQLGTSEAGPDPNREARAGGVALARIAALGDGEYSVWHDHSFVDVLHRWCRRTSP